MDTTELETKKKRHEINGNAWNKDDKTTAINHNTRDRVEEMAEQ